MPYTLKPNKIYAKDPNGDGYLPQNVVTDQTTAESVAQISSAGAAQIQAIVDKGAETRATIPSDYTTLSDDVTDLKSAIDNIFNYQTEQNIKPASTEPGGIYYSNGNNHNSSSALNSYVRTDYIPINKGDTLTFTGVRQYTTYAVVAFYNASKTYDQTLSIAGTNTNGQAGGITFTESGYIRLSCGAGSYETATFTLINSIGQAEKALSDRVTNIESTVNDTLDLSGSAWEIGSITTSGHITSSTVRIRSKFIPADYVSVHFTITEGYRFAAVWYSAMNADSFLRDDYWNTSEITLVPPDGTKYLRLVVGKVVEEDATLDYRNEISADGMISVSSLDETVTEIDADIADLDARVNALENNIPSRWKTYMENKYPILWEKDGQIGSGGDSFVFITDLHYERNELQSPKIIKQIVSKTAVKKVFCGGDLIDHQDTAALAIEKLESWQSLFSGLCVFNIVGNHDNNNYDSSQPNAALTKGQFYGIMVKPEEQWINTGGELYYCVDNESQKIRYICLAIECFDDIGSSGIQRTWLQSKLTEKDSSWTILVIQHRIWGSSTASIATNAQNVINAINEVWANINAKFIGIIAGHTHLDYNITEPTYGYNLIAVNCDANTGNNSGYTRTAGTTTEQSFDVMYIDKTNSKLYAVRIGAGDTSVGGGTGIREFNY